MKKLIALLMSMLMVISLCACGANDQPIETPSDVTNDTVVTTPVETPDETPIVEDKPEVITDIDIVSGEVYTVEEVGDITFGELTKTVSESKSMPGETITSFDRIVTIVYTGETNSKPYTSLVGTTPLYNANDNKTTIGMKDNIAVNENGENLHMINPVGFNKCTNGETYYIRLNDTTRPQEPVPETITKTYEIGGINFHFTANVADIPVAE